MAQSSSDKEKKVTFFSKDAIHCPVCDSAFHREELFSGGGRLNADVMTDELHRTYLASAKVGEVHPLIYPVTVCPSCYFAALQSDFTSANQKVTAALHDDIGKRIESVQTVFPALEFNAPRKLQEGVASYFLAMRCYDSFTKDYAPTIKQGICALRAAWLLGYLHAKLPNDNYDYLQGLFYRKALFFYKYAVEKETKGKEPLSTAKNLGPDTDKNYGYEGVLYLCGLLELKYGSDEDVEKRKQNLLYHKRTIAKMFGLGRSSKSKPGPLMEKARELYDRLKKETNEDSDTDE
jgi:uncharacterized protein